VIYSPLALITHANGTETVVSAGMRVPSFG